MNNHHSSIAENGKKDSRNSDDYLTISAFDSFLLGMVGLVLFAILLWSIAAP